jgi:hypothetical protein
VHPIYGGKAILRHESGIYFALVTGHTIQGDHVALLRGGRYPVVLREIGPSWEIIGECYIHGIMQGELYQGRDSRKLTLI